MAFYIFYVGIYENQHTFKLGQTIDFRRRIKEHKELKGGLVHNITEEAPVIHYLIKSPNYLEIEEGFKRRMWDLNLIVNQVINGENKVELFKITEEYSIDKIIGIVNDIVKLVNANTWIFKDKKPNISYKLPNKDGKTLPCDTCSKLFATPQNLTAHKKNCKNKDLITVAVEKVKGEVINEKVDLLVKIKMLEQQVLQVTNNQATAIPQNNYECELCEKNFTTQLILEKHIKICDIIKNYKKKIEKHQTRADNLFENNIKLRDRKHLFNQIVINVEEEMIIVDNALNKIKTFLGSYNMCE